MGTLLWLATEAGAIGEESVGGFGLNFDILETNLINLAIVVGLMIYFMRQFLGQILSDRRSTIEAAIQEAEKKCKDAAIALAEQQQKLAQAEVEAEKIRKQAAENAAKAKAAILAQATEDVKRLKETVVQDLDLVRERAIAELRQRVVKQALTQAESQLKGRMDESVQQRLVERSISLLGGSQ